ncbi:MAG: hypothetical protein D6805_01195 [Planctomycetota bacterium]|nr:MAG: hypothetical protein D6805_01195 [Planctomycetota bacterium]
MKRFPILFSLLVLCLGADSSTKKKSWIRISSTKENVVASRILGTWTPDPNLVERLTGQKYTNSMKKTTIQFTKDMSIVKHLPNWLFQALKRKQMVLPIYLAGYFTLNNFPCEGRKGKYPYILTTVHGNPHVIFFRPRHNHPMGDGESFNVMLARAEKKKYDILFIGGDFNNQPFFPLQRLR